MHLTPQTRSLEKTAPTTFGGCSCRDLAQLPGTLADSKLRLGERRSSCGWFLTECGMIELLRHRSWTSDCHVAVQSWGTTLPQIPQKLNELLRVSLDLVAS